MPIFYVFSENLAHYETVEIREMMYFYCNVLDDGNNRFIGEPLINYNVSVD